MIEVWILIALLVLCIMGTIASTGWDCLELRNREVWWWTCVLILEALLMDNLYAALLLATIILGLFQIGRSWYVLRGTIIPIAGIAGIYALVTPHMRIWMVPWLLWAGVFIGLVLAAWAALGLYVTRRPFRFMIPTWLNWLGMWGVYEDLQETTLRNLCGQANPSHLCSLSALCMACAAGLLWMGQWWALPALLFCYLPIHVNWLASGWNRHPNVGHVALVGLAFACLALVFDWRYSAGLLSASVIAASGYTAWNYKKWFKADWVWIDSGRLVYWTDVFLLVFWPAGWRARLFGFGTCTWFLKTVLMGEALHKHVFTAAHNEYFQQLIEHGLIGLGLMLLFLGDALWRTLHGVPEQQAIFLLGMVWCCIAFVNFPATFYHEYHPSVDKDEKWYGSPPLNVWTLLIAILAEVK
jgi:hypothetical protein